MGLVALIGHGSIAVSQDRLRTERPAGPMKLHLEVFVNGEPLNLVGEFTKGTDGALASTRAELKQLGVAVPGSGDDKQVVSLETIPGLGMRYDAAGQKLHLTLTEDARAAREYVADPPTGALPEQKVEVSNELGLVLNYNAFATAGRSLTGSQQSYRTGSLSLDGRIFSPIGVLQQSAILGTTLNKDGYLRLDSSFVFAHRDTMTVTTLGDSVSGGLAWSRSVRQGGLQINRQFSLRPDLVTAPMPSVSGSAAVPSTVDVFVDNVRVASQQVGSGPFRISNLSVPSEAGTARVVVRDVTGKETVTSLPFFTSAKLLGKGYLDFSIDAGFPRLNYALESYDYSRRFFGMGSVRYGLTETLTLESHAEATTRLANGGLGVVFGGGKWGLFSIAAAGSWNKGDYGGLGYASWQKNFTHFFLAASTQRTIGKYEDVASVSARNNQVRLSQNLTDSGFYLLNRSPRVSRALDRITLGVPIPQWNASFAVSFINVERANKEKSHLLNVSYSQTIAEKYHLFVSAYGDLANKREAGIIAGLSFTFGPDITATTSGAFSRDGRSGGIELSRALGQKPHDYAWRVFDSEGTNAQRGASGVYANPWSRIEAGIRQDRNNVTGYGEIDGALVATPAGVFASRRVNDAFAIVDAGAPGVEILHENRSIGKTGFTGKVLIPNLQSFQRAKLAIEPESLPKDRLASMTETEVIPGYRGSSTVSVKAMHINDTARVALRDAGNNPFPAGTRVQHLEAGVSYTIGYGSVAYLPRVDEENTLVIQQGTASCRAQFRKADRQGAQGKVGPLTCQP